MGYRRTTRLAMSAGIASTGLLGVITAAYLFTREPAPEVRVEWRQSVTPERRAELERRFLLVRPRPYEDALAYDLLDTSRANIEALVRERDVADTDGIRQRDFTLPADYTYGIGWTWLVYRLPWLRAPGVVPAIVGLCIAMLAGCAGIMMRAAGRRAVRPPP